MKLIYTAHSVRTKCLARVIALLIVKEGNVPVNPFICFPKTILRHRNPLKYDLELLKRCDEVHVFGKPDEGVKTEMKVAEEKGIKIVRRKLFEKS